MNTKKYKTILENVRCFQAGVQQIKIPQMKIFGGAKV